MPVYKLYYFNTRGLGEVIRQTFAHAGVEYEDIRVEDDEWESKYKSKAPFGCMPVLLVDGKPIPQSFAIARFVASQHGLAGKTPFEAAWVDALADQYKDYMAEFRKFWYVHLGYREGDAEALKKEVGEVARDSFFPLIEKQLKSNGTGFLVGDSVTWVDFMVAEHAATILEKIPTFLNSYPDILAYSKKIQSIPQIKKWIEKRPADA